MAATRARRRWIGLERDAGAQDPLKVASEVLAHPGIRITADLYGHLEDDVLREQLAILDAAWAADEELMT
jgi:hypothetical protein